MPTCRSDQLRGTRSFALQSELIRHARHDDVVLEEQRPFDEERMLVVEQVLPQPTRHELGQDHRDEAVGIRTLDLFNVIEQRLQQRSKRRLEYDEVNVLPYGHVTGKNADDHVHFELGYITLTPREISEDRMEQPQENRPRFAFEERRRRDRRGAEPEET